jgi:NAD-dependent dihydropyrimidine dehydrogenase PreA subunit
MCPEDLKSFLLSSVRKWHKLQKIKVLRAKKIMIDQVDDKKCNGCGVCVEICPMDVLRMKTDVDITSEKKWLSQKSIAYIAYRNDCMTCYTCELQCPTGAIDVGYAPLEIPFVID